jgi:hypothetical protein
MPSLTDFCEGILELLPKGGGMTRAQKGQRAKQRRTSRVPGTYMHSVPFVETFVGPIAIPVEPMPVSWLRRLWNSIKNHLSFS